MERPMSWTSYQPRSKSGNAQRQVTFNTPNCSRSTGAKGENGFSPPKAIIQRFTGRGDFRRAAQQTSFCSAD